MLLPKTTAVAFAVAAAAAGSRRRRIRCCCRRIESPPKLVERGAVPLVLLELGSERSSRPLVVDGLSVAVMSTVESELEGVSRWPKATNGNAQLP